MNVVVLDNQNFQGLASHHHQLQIQGEHFCFQDNFFIPTKYITWAKNNANSVSQAFMIYSILHEFRKEFISTKA